MQGKTSSGFSFNISKAKLDDIRFVKLLRETKTDMSAITDVVEYLLGDDEEKLYKHLQKKSGQIPMTDVMNELNEIFELLGESAKK